MTFRESFLAVKQLLESRLHDFGLVSADADTMGWTTMLSIQQNTRITIDVPLSLVYSDEFLISGTLETSTYSRLNGKTVKLKVGDTIVDTTVTNVNGEYSFTHTPVSTGNHSFQVIFEGTSYYNSSQSSVVNRTVGKETSVINLDTISTQHYGDTFVLGGQLLDNDGQYIQNASVEYYVDDSLLDILTTNAQGRFSRSEVIDNFDSFDVNFVYDGDNNYTDCSASGEINVYPLELYLSSNKSMLSVVDNEYATLTAQFKDSSGANLPIIDEFVTFTAHSYGNLFSETIINEENDSPRLVGDTISIDFTNIADNVLLVLNSENDVSLSIDYRSGGEIYLAEYAPDDDESFDETDFLNTMIPGSSLTIDLADKTIDGILDIHSYYDSVEPVSFLNSTDYISILSDAELIDDVLTDNNGVATITYYANGKGELEIRASCNGIVDIESEGTSIIDCVKFVPEVTNLHQLTRFRSKGSGTLSIAKNNDGSYTTTRSGWSSIDMIEFENVPADTNIFMEYDWKYNIDQFKFVIEYSRSLFDGVMISSYLGGGIGKSNVDDIRYDSNNVEGKVDVSLTQGNWYHVSVNKIEDTFYVSIVDDTNSLKEFSVDTTTSGYNNIIFGLGLGYYGTNDGRGYNNYIKNIEYYYY